jgi:hypothetical protein
MLLDRWGDHPGVDWWIAAVFAAAGRLLMDRWNMPAWSDSDEAKSAFLAAAGVMATIGSLSSIGVAISASASGRRTSALHRSSGPALVRNWMAVLTVTVIASFAMLIASLIPPTAADTAVCFSVSLWSLAMVRLVWLIGKILALHELDQSEPRPAPAPRVRQVKP